MINAQLATRLSMTTNCNGNNQWQLQYFASVTTDEQQISMKNSDKWFTMKLLMINNGNFSQWQQMMTLPWYWCYDEQKQQL